MPSGDLGFGQRTQAVRLEHDVSKAKAAARLDITDRTHKFYELGKRKMPISTALKYHDAFGAKLKWLATGSGPKPPLQEGSFVEEAALAFPRVYNQKGLNPPTERITKQVSSVMDEPSVWDLRR